MSRSLLEQLKRFLEQTTIATSGGSGSGDPLVLAELVDVNTELDAQTLDLSAIQTDVAATHSDSLLQTVELVTSSGLLSDIFDQLATNDNSVQSDVRLDLKRGRTNFGGKLDVLHLGTSSGTVASALGTSAGGRIRKIMVSYDKPNAANEFRITLNGAIMAQFWIPANHATSPFWIDLGEFYWTANVANPTFQIARTSGANEIQMTVYFEDLAEDQDDYPTT